MAARKGGIRSRTRRKFKKSHRDKGKISLTKYFTQYIIGDRAVLKAEPAVQKSLYHKRFHGRSVIVTGKRGSNYELKIKDGGKEKTLYVHPIHLKKV